MSEYHLAHRVLDFASQLMFRISGKSAPTEHFYRVIEMYRNQAKEVPFLNDFDIRKVHTWEEVFRAADLAHEKCKRDERRSVLRKLGRVAQRSAPAMSPWLELIPNGNYTSALYGGLKIVFNVRTHGSLTSIHEQLKIFRLPVV